MAAFNPEISDVSHIGSIPGTVERGGDGRGWKIAGPPDPAPSRDPSSIRELDYDPVDQQLQDPLPLGQRRLIEP
jgi:hypothetical protein